MIVLIFFKCSESYLPLFNIFIIYIDPIWNDFIINN